MGNLELITTETFGSISCDFYRMNDEILLTREQIGQALEYADPVKAIQKIHFKHKDRLDRLSTRIKTDTFDYPQTGVCRKNNNLQIERVYYTERGVMEICRWSRQPNANAFMDWVWDIVGLYRKNQLKQVDTSKLERIIEDMSRTISNLTKVVLNMKKDMNQNKQTCNNNAQLTNNKWSYWSTKMYPKYQSLAEYFGISHRELYKNLYIELQNRYPNIDLMQCVHDYRHEHNLDSAFMLEAIEHDTRIREIFESMVDDLLHRYGLSTKENKAKITIFQRGSGDSDV